ncbi:LuxR C-terminal-related transcriptional regulator [Clostridium sp.]|jgi:LuxR family maltose regulon positive regulatory protein|uniref:helix-turn-helix transcriptional regulator n=1 Tax=Clostridium sp. TaxID=1506 RepID=UPI002588EED8|nr:LuxR C-terminal-related transcriptional regulator [Clostridium sp.]MDF2502802.1 transcriptional regulator, LuxR family [Clostridium sp.]
MKQDLKFISTKLKMPLPRENYIKRILLMDRLKGIMNNKITIIKGCAACGKTTLLTSFLREYSICKVKWISLDKDNNNIFSFWHYLLEAIKDFLGSERKEILNSFESVIRKKDIENILVIVINQLVKAEEFIIVLDDFHTINDKNTLDSVNLFVKYFPENIHLIILTRGDTGLYFGEIAMEGNLIEIDEEELRFTSIEEKRFLIETLNMDLKEEVIAKINNISEGWIGGVQLIALAINNGKDNVIKDINILNKYMIDYLSKEILESLSKEEKDFLICTAILSYFNKDIANELLDKTNCREIIESLVSKDLFLINIDGENYRYHTMLSEFLNLEFSKINKNRAKNLHLKASKIFKNIGDLDESINHLLEIEEYEKSLELIEVMGQNPKGWVYLTKIPLEIIKSNRELLIQRIFYDLCNMEMGKCRKMLNSVSKKIEDTFSQKIILFARALAEDYEVDIASLETITAEEMESMKLNAVTKAIVYIKTSLLLRLKDKYFEAMDLIDRVIYIEKSINNMYIKFFALCLKAQVKEDIGELNDCCLIYDEMFYILDKYKFLNPLKITAYIGVVGIYIKMNMPAKAEEYLNIIDKIIDNNNSVSADHAHLWNTMELKVLQKKGKEASKIIDKLMHRYIYNNSIYKFSIMRYSIYINDFNKYNIEDLILYFETNINKINITVDQKIVYARLLFINGKKEKALNFIDDILKVTRKNKMKIQLIYGILLKVIILDKEFIFNKREILNLIREAIYYSFENKIAAPFIFEGERIENLISLLLSERSKDLSVKEKEFISNSLKINSENKNQELLTNREVEVMVELSKGFSNKEIAEKLCISLATVKTHVINIYSKLQVSSRVAAVEKARNINIIK